MSQIALEIPGRVADLGGFTVTRLLPYVRKRTVGPFIFVDHMGPFRFAPGAGMDVRPHPHIGLSTVTYLFEGEILHRDSLGSEQEIQPGDVNWMTAGRGIAHSERSTASARAAGAAMNGLQVWVALPKANEETAPTFKHYEKATIPRFTQEGVLGSLIAGDLLGLRSPAQAFSPMFYLNLLFAKPGASITVPYAKQEAAVYVLSGSVAVGDDIVKAGSCVVLKAGDEVTLKEAGAGAAHAVIFGGEELDGPRTIWWNFVSSSEERLEQAKDDWRNGRFGKVEGDDEFIPLPEA